MKKPPQLPSIPELDLDGFKLDVQYYVQNEYEDIHNAAVELPTIIEWLNYQHQRALEMKLRQRSLVERIEATAYFALKNGEFQSRGYGDKPTADALKAAVALDDDVIKEAEDLAVWSALEDRLERIMKSLSAKLDLVRSSEATRRKLVE